MKQLSHQFFRLVLIMLLSVNCFAMTWSDFTKRFYVGAEGGVSFANDINLKPTSSIACTPTQQCWDNPFQSFNAPLGNAPLWGGKIGYHINKLFALDVSYDSRNSFSWGKTFPANPFGFNAPRKRFIGAIRDQTLMGNLYITPNLQWSTLDPFVNVGMGWAWNRTGNLTSINLSTGEVAIITGASDTTFAWDIGAGTNIIVDKNLFFDVGYRFLSFGKIETGTTVLSPLPVLPIPRLQNSAAYANEIYAGINYLL